MPDHAKQVGILCQRVIDLLGLSMTEGQSILLGESNVAHIQPSCKMARLMV